MKNLRRFRQEYARWFETASENMILEPGTIGRLRHYDILRVAGRGGMGIVLKAFDRSLRGIPRSEAPASERTAHKAPALRTILEAGASGQCVPGLEPRNELKRHNLSAAAISHEHVVTIHAVEESPPFLVMQYVHGETLEERIHRNGSLDVREAVRIALQIAQGLAAAHAQGVVHRDIKPANILLENGVARVRITDFGLARAVDDASLTQSGVVAGTPQYMAPEQANGDAIRRNPGERLGVSPPCRYAFRNQTTTRKRLNPKSIIRSRGGNSCRCLCGDRFADPTHFSTHPGETAAWFCKQEFNIRKPIRKFCGSRNTKPITFHRSIAVTGMAEHVDSASRRMDMQLLLPGTPSIVWNEFRRACCRFRGPINDGRCLCRVAAHRIILVPSIQSPPQPKPSVTYPFVISRDVISMAQFQQFVADTGYVTDAERGQPLTAPQLLPPQPPLPKERTPATESDVIVEDATTALPAGTIGGWLREEGSPGISFVRDLVSRGCGTADTDSAC